MPIPIFSYDRYRLKTDTDIFINTDADTDMVLADTDMIKTYTDISVSAKNISQPIYRSISTSNISLVVLDKLLFGFQSPNLLQKWIKQYKFGRIRQITMF